MPDSSNPWHIRCTFEDDSTYRERGLVKDGAVVGVEERIFNADGSLRPLPDRRRSPADDEQSAQEDARDRSEDRRLLRAERGHPDA